MAEIVFDQVSFAWPGGKEILNEASFTLKSGSFTLVTGPSGVGKSSLLRLINRLEEPRTGTILLDGKPLPDYDPPRLRRDLVYLQQKPVVLDCRVRESMLIPFDFALARELPRPDDTTLREVLDRLFLNDISLDQQAQSLSEGQKQRLCFSRLLLLRPRMILLDEPTSSLDGQSRARVESLITTFCTEGTTVVMITHDDFSPKGMDATTLCFNKGEIGIMK
jgi:putative ABC transport system ATP-binding protein